MGNYSMTKKARIYNGEKTASSICVAGETGQLHVKEWNQNNTQPYIKINSKHIKDLNVRPDTIKLRGKHGRTLYDINHSKNLFDPPSREMEIKTKLNK